MMLHSGVLFCGYVAGWFAGLIFHIQKDSIQLWTVPASQEEGSPGNQPSLSAGFYSSQQLESFELATRSTKPVGLD